MRLISQLRGAIVNIDLLASRMRRSSLYAGHTRARAPCTKRWHGTRLFFAFTVLLLCIYTYLGRLLPQNEPMMLLIHILDA